MLSADDKERIRLEEIYRDEVRHGLDPKSQSATMKFLNSPFGLYLLSTVLIGIVSFSYSRWKEHHDTAMVHREQAEKLRDEMAFRVRQFDIALTAANQHLTLAEAAPEPGPDDLLKSKKSLNIAMQAVPVVVRLGGLGEIPGDLTAGTWVRFRDVDVQPSLLPFNRGYKSKDYAFETLSDLAADIARVQGADRITQERNELQRNLDALQEPAYKFLNFAAFRANTDYPVSGPPITSMRVLASGYKELLKPIMDGWTKVKQSALVRENLAP
jgi:hypothetical protein